LSSEEHSSAARYAVGIDLGTTNCVLSYVELHSEQEPAPHHVMPISQLTSPGSVEEKSQLPSFMYQAHEAELAQGDTALPWNATPDTIVGAIARELGVGEVVIGVTLVAVATSLPELAVSLASALKGEYGLAIGNIVGSNIFNLLAVIGVAAAISPVTLEHSVLSLHVFVMVAFTLILFAMTYDYDGKSELSRLEGTALLLAFVAYDYYVVSQNI